MTTALEIDEREMLEGRGFEMIIPEQQKFFRTLFPRGSRYYVVVDDTDESGDGFSYTFALATDGTVWRADDAVYLDPYFEYVAPESGLGSRVH